MLTVENDQDSKKYFGARVETINRLKELYTEDYFEDETLTAQREIMYKQELLRMRKYVDMEAGGKVLDIGCGPGKFLSHFGKQWEKYGTEVSPWARELAEKNGVVTNLEFKDNFFDLIVFRGTWQHIPDPVSRIEECYYWLKKGGRIVFLATPNLNSLYYKVFGRSYTPVNFVTPTDKMLAQILRNFGFIVLGFEYPYLGTPYADPVKDSINLVLKFLHLKKGEVPTFGKVMECYAMK